MLHLKHFKGSRLFMDGGDYLRGNTVLLTCPLKSETEVVLSSLKHLHL